ncbi:glycoside hydrolase family 10 protein [filamentous cyanobacterium LEGE 11480]|uniref:Glycoside hydrolase family 10 protein n=2 Tax=Romeriopsis TaxID=2992131 RepID=A0A928VJL3_9CYAN|nr:glycoside hydrolase family 10 protein [Romeriopsis navalis LEGE 11480]
MRLTQSLRRWFIALLIGIATLVFSSGYQPAPATSSPPREIRGVWLTNVDSPVLFQGERLQQAVNDLAAHHFNTMYPVVWNWGYTTYPSTVAKRTIGSAVDPRPDSLQNRDMLTELVQAAHTRQIAVMPWFEFGFMAPEDSALAMRHPDWLTQKRDGSKVWQEGIYPRVWLNPLRPEVQQFIHDLLLEIVSRYDIDGIQLDDHFGLPAEFGYDRFTTALYQQEHNDRKPPSNPQDREWIRWRADKITAFTQQLFRDIKAQKSEVIFGLSPNNYRFSLNHSLQDWRRWERAGYVEELVLQVYRDSDRAFRHELRHPEVQAARRHIPVAVGILSGLRNKPVSMAQIQQQVNTVRQEKFAGVAFFFYETLWNLTPESQQQRQAGLKQLFPAAVDRVNLSI